MPTLWQPYYALDQRALCGFYHRLQAAFKAFNEIGLFGYLSVCVSDCLNGHIFARSLRVAS